MSWDESCLWWSEPRPATGRPTASWSRASTRSSTRVALARLRNPTEAQELTQEVFIHGMSKLDQLRDPHCFAGWLRQITVRMAINRLTRRGPLCSTDQEMLQNTAAEATSPLDDLVRTEQQAELYRGWNG